MSETDRKNEKEAYDAQINVEQLQAVLQRYCLSLTRSKWDAEDLVQETWLKALRAAVQSNHLNPEALLLRIAKNTWIDQMRRQNHFQLLVQQGKHISSEIETSIHDLEETMYSLIRHLSPLQRTVFLMRDVFQFSIEETANKLNTTTGAIKAALYRAREALLVVKKEIISETYVMPDDEQMKSFIRAMAVAYQSGDTALLISLAQMDMIEASIVFSISQSQTSKAVKINAYKREEHSFTMQMAA